ncbi:MAG: MGMT family protein [Synergistales bacterium]|nr:MGMT family protein [Synergistales bacterium]
MVVNHREAVPVLNGSGCSILYLPEGKPCSAATVEGEVGRWRLWWSEKGLHAVEALSRAEDRGESDDLPLPGWLERAWRRVWAGELPGAVLLATKPVKPFTAAVYREALQIPFGRTESYKGLAEAAGSPRAARAVGAVMRANPWPLFVPCHRVIGTKGDLRGYGGPRGTPLKQRLLDYERSRSPVQQ